MTTTNMSKSSTLKTIPQEVMFVTFNLNKHITSITAKLAYFLQGKTPSYFLGKDLEQLQLKIYNGDILKNFYAIFDKVVVSKKPMAFLHISDSFYHPDNEPEYNYHMITLNNIYPLFNEDNNTIGTLIHVNTFKNVNFFHNIYYHQHAPLIEKINQLNLTNREFEIIFLLTQGLNQRHIANILGVERGTISKIIIEKLMPKFKLSSTSVALITQKAVKLGINNILPKRLVNPCIIELDNMSSLF